MEKKLSDMEGKGCCSNGADDDGSFASRYTQAYGMRVRWAEDPVRRRWRTWPSGKMGGGDVRYNVARDWRRW
jgi:hypothetical protein